MSLENIYYVGQTVAVIGLIISIVFAAVQIRQNTRAVRAASRYDVDMGWAQITLELAKDPESTRLWSDIIRADARPGDISSLDMARMHLMFRSVMFTFQAHYFLAHEGSLPREHWEHEREFVRRLIRTPVGAHLYQLELDQRTIRDGVREEIEIQSAFGAFGEKSAAAAAAPA